MNAGGRPGKTEERETMAETLKDLLAPHPAEWPAIGAPGRPWMTYGGLRDLSADVAASLRSNRFLPSLPMRRVVAFQEMFQVE